MTKALLFDLGDVIVGLDFDRAYRAAAQLCGRKVEEIPEIIREAGLAEPYERGEISSPQFHQRFVEALGLDAPFDEFRRIWEDMFLPDPLLPESLFSGLANKYRLVLLSNTNELHFESLRRKFNQLSYFDEYVLSYQVGALKPDEEIYRVAVSKAQCRPNECFFVDDKPANVEGAVRAGVDAVQFCGGAELERALRQRGIHWQ